MATLVIRPIIGRISMSGILDSMSLVVLGMATIAASHGVVRGKAVDVTSKIRGGPVVTKHASPLRSGRARITMDIGCTPITLCGIAQILPLRHRQWMLTLRQRKWMLTSLRHQKWKLLPRRRPWHGLPCRSVTRHLPSFGRPPSITPPPRTGVAKRMASIVVIPVAARGRAADAS